ncbi:MULTISPECIES: DUF6491 family protein [unclassified Dyella]|uniref:DUF6491 family protein n=1 Tax=unclassified Dyella TaxID=2634549 RepID=UPI000C851CF3|nr:MULTISPECIES: DUF6491 family protein [unclassified Dyella]MDR3447205.1 DUF6491 family protein [Dyella sp.]PMQ06612.1 hypothetical protein DyAD56_03890 [Dyella sp. AD56]
MAAKHLLAAVAVVAALGGCTRVGKDYTSRMEARQQAYAAAAGDPVNSFHYFSLWSWEPLSDEQLAIYTRSNEAWLIDLDGRCRNLEFTNHIALTSSASEVSVKFDRVLTGPPDPPCFIKQIRPVDLKKLDSPQQGKPREVEETARPAK